MTLTIFRRCGTKAKHHNATSTVSDCQRDRLPMGKRDLEAAKNLDETHEGCYA